MKKEELLFNGISELPDDIIEEAAPDITEVKIVHKKGNAFIKIAAAAAAVVLVCGISYRHIIEPKIYRSQITGMIAPYEEQLLNNENISEEDLKILSSFDVHKHMLDTGITKILDTFTLDDKLYILTETEGAEKKVLVYNTSGIKAGQITGFIYNERTNLFDSILPCSENSVYYLSCYGDGDTKEENALIISDCSGNLYSIDLSDGNEHADNFSVVSAVSDSNGMIYVLYDSLETIEKHQEVRKLSSCVMKLDLSDPEADREIIYLDSDVRSEDMICVSDRIFISAACNTGYRIYEADFSEGKAVNTDAPAAETLNVRLSGQGLALMDNGVFDLISGRMTDRKLNETELYSLWFMTAGDAFIYVPENADILGNYSFLTLRNKEFPEADNTEYTITTDQEISETNDEIPETVTENISDNITVSSDTEEENDHSEFTETESVYIKNVSAVMDKNSTPGKEFSNIISLKISEFAKEGETIESFSFNIHSEDGESKLGDLKTGTGITVTSDCPYSSSENWYQEHERTDYTENSSFTVTWKIPDEIKKYTDNSSGAILFGYWWSETDKIVLDSIECRKTVKE